MILRFFPQENGLVGIVAESELGGAMLAYGEIPVDHIIEAIVQSDCTPGDSCDLQAYAQFKPSLAVLKNVGR